MLLFQTVHDRAFDLGQVQFDPHVAQSCVDRFKRFQRAKVDLVDGRAHQHDMAQTGVARQPVVDAILQEPRVGEIQALVDAQGQHRWAGLYLVAVDIAEVFGARDQPDFGNMRFGGFIEMQKDRQHHPQVTPSSTPLPKVISMVDSTAAKSDLE